MEQQKPLIDPKSGFCGETGTFHSLIPPVHLPQPEAAALSAAEFAFSLQSTWPWSAASTIALIDSASGHRFSCSEFTRRVKNLAASLQTLTALSKGDAAFILSPNSTSVPILYFSLLSLGVIISPANPAADELEILRELEISKPVIAFATSGNSKKLPEMRLGTILIDLPEFESMMGGSDKQLEPVQVDVRQNDVAAIIYSSGTTGGGKGVALTHGNLIAVIGIYHAVRRGRQSSPVQLFTTPLFHVYGFFYSVRSVALCETAVVLTGNFDARGVLRAVEEFRVTHVAATPPLVTAMVGGEVAEGFDTTSLESVACGGAPLRKGVVEAFKTKFPRALIAQVRTNHLFV